MIYAIQQLLKLKGLYQGEIDGIFGQKSLQAIQFSDKPTLQTVQSLLKDLGLYEGRIDGIFGPASYKALNCIIPAATITAAQLERIYPGANTNFVSFINQYKAEYGITTKAQLCAFLANTLVESGGFNRLRENMNYSGSGLYKTFKNMFLTIDEAKRTAYLGPKAIANKVYGGRLGNGIKNNDGFNYRGGGLIQTTGKKNYSLTGKAIGVDLVNFPDRITDLDIAVKSAMWYWQSNKCGQYADESNFKECTRLINRGLLDFEKRQALNQLSWSVLT